MPAAYNYGTPYSCHSIWDSAQARLSPCVMPYLSAIPAAIVLIIAVNYLLGGSLNRWRPKWTLPFVPETISEDSELPREGPMQHSHWMVILLILSIIGMTAKVVQLIPPGLDPAAIALVFSWAAAALLIAIKRPRSYPTSMFTFYIAAFVVELSYAFNRNASAWSRNIAHYVSIGASASACLTIMLMPFRNPSLSVIGISAVGQVPSREFRSPEDNLRLWQFLSVSWMAPLMSVGKKRQLNKEDVWFLGFQFQHRRLHEKFRRLKGSVLSRLLQANGIDVFLIGVIAITQMLCDFSTPLLLQQLLQVMKDPDSPKRVALTYALLTLIVRLVAAQLAIFQLWYGRRCYERSRGELIMMVYEKALSRKNVFEQEVKEESTEFENQGGQSLDNGDANHEINSSKSNQRKLRGIFPRKRKSYRKRTKETATMGKIFNLLRGDVYEVSQRFWEGDRLIERPVGLVIATILVWKLFGPSCFLGIMVVIVAQLINAIITRTLLRWERVRRKATDTRLQITSQFVEAIRHLRWYGWQDHWLHQVMDARDNELTLRIVTSLWNILIRFINSFASGVFPVVSLYAYTLLAGHPLRIDIIFPALQLFTMLETRLREIPNLITTLINATIAMGRIEDFMSEPDKENQKNEPSDGNSLIELKSCSFAWPGRTSPVLSDLSLTIPKGLTVVCGKVGAGKTAFLQALLGELDKLKGTTHIPDAMVGYCAQTPWLQSMSIRDNILFSSPYNEQRYKRVLDVCALGPDLANFKHGDLTFIGENGVGLSGGQKARVALARAVYSTARTLLLDDPISALDHNTAESVVRKCFSGPLMQDRIIVLATHRTVLVSDIAEQCIEIVNGHAEVYSKGGIPSAVAEARLKANEPESGDEAALEEVASVVIPDKFIEEEHRAEWGVQARVYWDYIKAGRLKWWAALIAVLTVYRLSAVGQSWFLKQWGEAYDQIRLLFAYFGSNRKGYMSEWALVAPLPGNSSTGAYSKVPNPIDKLPPPLEDVRPWLLTFFIITTFQSVTLLIAQLLMLVIIYFAGKTLFQQVMARVSHATFRFFDVTPVGRLMNRLTSDIGVVDGNISDQFQIIAFQAITWISSILVIASVTPTFLIFSLLLTAAFITIFLRFLPSSQSLRRLEMVSLSPLLSNFGELLHGLTTVRAFRAKVRFQNRVIKVVDEFQGMDHFYWALQGWLMYRFECLSGLSTFCLTALALYTNASPGLVAFVLIAANSFVESTHILCKQYGQLQMDFVSVERIDELLHIEQESKGTIDPPASWPTFGSDIVFEDVTIRYAVHLDPSLRNISLRIPGGSTAAVIGRTGSGKSTLALSLLGVVQPETGQILVDNIDISKVNTQSLRTRVTFVAQDPILFPGSIRLNLDPTGDYSDEECAEVLHRVCGRHGWTLETHIQAGGRNLSHGQRQLIGLTRAVLRRSPIVILDEATASIDHETSLQIQEIIREEMKESTVITVAHRLEAIRNADYYIVLEQGRVSRTGNVEISEPDGD